MMNSKDLPMLIVTDGSRVKPSSIHSCFFQLIPHLVSAYEIMFISNISRLVTVAVYFIKSYQLAGSIEDSNTAKSGDK